MSKRQISERDENRLTWYFSIGQAEFFRSPFGAMLAKAEEKALSSDLAPNGEHLRHPRKQRGVQYVKTNEDRNASLVYEPELQVLSMFGWVSRRIRWIEKRDPTSAVLLERYYGDVGAVWGKIIAVYPLTKSGRRLLRDCDKQFDMTAEQRIGIEVELQKVQGNETRGRRIRRMQDEAEEMLKKAWEVWRQSDQELKRAA